MFEILEHLPYLLNVEQVVLFKHNVLAQRNRYLWSVLLQNKAIIH